MSIIKKYSREFPGSHHKTNFGLLAKTMHEVFDEESQKSQKPRLLASIATAAGEWLLKHGYDIPVLCKVIYLYTKIW